MSTQIKLYQEATYITLHDKSIVITTIPYQAIMGSLDKKFLNLDGDRTIAVSSISKIDKKKPTEMECFRLGLSSDALQELDIREQQLLSKLGRSWDSTHEAVRRLTHKNLLS